MEVRDAGWQLVDYLRVDPTTAQVAVLVCSADADILIQCAGRLRQYGTNTILKPFAIDELLDRVHQLLGPESP